MMIAVFILLGLVATSVVFGVCAVAFAPVGYQDESGFHFGPKESMQPTEAMAYAMTEAKAAA